MNKRLNFFLLLLLFGLSITLRLNHIADSGFNLDEMISARLAEFMNLQSLFLDNHPPLLQFLIRISTELFGFSELSSRLPAALCSAFATVVLGKICFRLFGLPSAIIAMTLHAVSPLSIEMAQLARPYGPLELFGLIQFYFLMIHNSLPTRKSRRNLLVASLFAILTSYLAVLLFALEYIYFLAKRGRAVWLIWGCLIFVVAFFASREIINWRSMDWQLLRYQFDRFGFLPLEPLMSFAYNSLYSLMGILCLLFLFTLQSKPDKLREATPLLISSLCVALTLIIISVATKRAIFVSRYYAFLFPIFILFFSQLIVGLWKNAKVWKRLIVCTCMGAVIIGALINLKQLYPIRQPAWRQSAELVSLYPSSVVITSISPSLEFPYFSRNQIPFQMLEAPTAIVEQLEKALQTHQSVWIIDSYWDYIIYKEGLAQAAGTLSLKIEDRTHLEANMDNIVVLRLFRN